MGDFKKWGSGILVMGGMILKWGGRYPFTNYEPMCWNFIRHICFLKIARYAFQVELLQYIIKVVIHVALSLLLCVNFFTWRIFSEIFTTVLNYLNFLRLE